MYRRLPDEILEPTYTPPNVELAVQREYLHELRELQNAIPTAQLARDERVTALARSGAVSRRDMARACGLNKSRIDQIIASHAEPLPCPYKTPDERVQRSLAPLGPSEAGIKIPPVSSRSECLSSACSSNE